MYGSPTSINHIAIELPDRETWLKQLAFMQSRGVKFSRKIDHGMSHSVYVNDPNGYGVELLYELPTTPRNGRRKAPKRLSMRSMRRSSASRSPRSGFGAGRHRRHLRFGGVGAACLGCMRGRAVPSRKLSDSIAAQRASARVAFRDLLRRPYSRNHPTLRPARCCAATYPKVIAGPIVMPAPG